MIPANELRIGNWVKYHDDTIICVTSEMIFAQDNANKTKGHGSWVYPIILNSEMLEKCGFENTGVYYKLQIGASYEKGTIILIIYKSRLQISIGTGGEGCEWIFLPAPTSIHQLQNLYFALTKQELEIKPYAH